MEFIRKLDRCRCFDEYAIDMEGNEKNGNENGRKQDEMQNNGERVEINKNISKKTYRRR